MGAVTCLAPGRCPSAELELQLSLQLPILRAGNTELVVRAKYDLAGAARGPLRVAWRGAYSAVRTEASTSHDSRRVRGEGLVAADAAG